MKLSKVAAIPALALAAGLGLAACGGQAHSAAPAPKAAATHSAVATPAAQGSQTPNPVSILKEAGATIKPGTVYGEKDLGGARYADGSFYGPGCTAADNCSENMDVRTFPDSGTMAAYVQQYGNGSYGVTDSSAVVTGPNFIVTLTPVDGGNGYAYYVSAATVGSRVHGTVQPLGS
jgi:hypothetical protein